jgi:hypothetical protein
MSQVGELPPKHPRRGTGPILEPPDSRVAAAEYLAAMAGELSALAGRQKFDTLVYLFSLARREAEIIAGRAENP